MITDPGWFAWTSPDEYDNAGPWDVPMWDPETDDTPQGWESECRDDVS